MLSGGRGEGRVIIGKGAGLWGGQATIMMCGCDGGWNGGDGSLNSLTAIGPYLAHRLFGLRSRLITFQIFVRRLRLIAQNVAELFNSNTGVSHL
jgi:hypothetical protein